MAATTAARRGESGGSSVVRIQRTSADGLHIHAGDLHGIDDAHAPVGREQNEEIAARGDEKVVRCRHAERAPAREVEGERLERRHVPQVFDVFDAHALSVASNETGCNGSVVCHRQVRPLIFKHERVCHSLTQRRLVGPGRVLEGERLLPGFQFPIADLFKEWDWD